jgi:predicted neutral ceramidase superfamily lipid hydrolase
MFLKKLFGKKRKGDDLYMSLLDWIALYLGTVLISGLLTRLVNWLLVKRIGRKRSAFISFFIIGTLAVSIYTIGDETLFTASLMYIPPLILWLIWDLSRVKEVKNTGDLGSNF